MNNFYLCIDSQNVYFFLYLNIVHSVFHNKFQILASLMKYSLKPKNIFFLISTDINIFDSLYL
jgi:hypothetical protein